MNLPKQGRPVLRRRRLGAIEQKGVKPSGTNTQCCGTRCMTKYCFIGLSSKGCDQNGNPYVHCI